VPHSAAELIQEWAPGAAVAKAFNTTNFRIMADPSVVDGPITMGVASDDAAAKLTAASIVTDAGFHFVDAGPLANAHYLEKMAAFYITFFFQDRPDAIDPGRFKGLVEFTDVSFSYDGKRPAVQDLSFTALPGQTIALVGPTGAGKSTAIALLHRAFDPQSGFIRIDGMDIRGIALGALRRNIGVVFQEALLFNRSIADNLRVGKSDASEQEMRQAADRAQALDFITRSDQKFEANAGERGRMLSGGERQRLSIARALLKDPPILILDEATSALDAVTEARVNAALDELMRGRTTFVIAHRLSTIRNATRILVFHEGQIVESGTFDELVTAGGRFAELARAQFMVAPLPPAALTSTNAP